MTYQVCIFRMGLFRWHWYFSSTVYDADGRTRTLRGAKRESDEATKIFEGMNS